MPSHHRATIVGIELERLTRNSRRVVEAASHHMNPGLMVVHHERQRLERFRLRYLRQRLVEAAQ